MEKDHNIVMKNIFLYGQQYLLARNTKIIFHDKF